MNLLLRSPAVPEKVTSTTSGISDQRDLLILSFGAAVGVDLAVGAGNGVFDRRMSWAADWDVGAGIDAGKGVFGCCDT